MLLPKHCCKPSTHLHSNSTLEWQWPLSAWWCTLTSAFVCGEAWKDFIAQKNVISSVYMANVLNLLDFWIILQISGNWLFEEKTDIAYLHQLLREGFSLDVGSLLWGFDCIQSKENWWGHSSLDHNYHSKSCQRSSIALRNIAQQYRGANQSLKQAR